MNQKNFTYIKILCNLLVFICSLILVIWVLPRLLVFFMPFVVAWIISCIVTPIVRFVEKHLKLKRRPSMVFVVVAIIGGVVAAIYNIVIHLGKIIARFLAELPVIWESFRIEMQGIFQILFNILDKFPGEDTVALEQMIANGSDYISNMVGSLSAPTISMVGNIAKQVPDMIIFTIMCLLATYFFVVERELIYQTIRKYTPKAVQNVCMIIKRGLLESVGGYFKAQFKIEIWIYLLVFIGLTILKIKYAYLIAFAIAILDLLPVFGTGAILWPWALLTLINGAYGTAVGLMLIWGISQLVRQFIQPKFVGDTLGVHPIPTLFLLFAGYKLAGVFGMIMAVPLGILVSTLYKAGVFENVEKSIRLLSGRISKLCKYDKNELEEIESYKEQEKE